MPGPRVSALALLIPPGLLFSAAALAADLSPASTIPPALAPMLLVQGLLAGLLLMSMGMHLLLGLRHANGRHAWLALLHAGLLLSVVGSALGSLATEGPMPWLLLHLGLIAALSALAGQAFHAWLPSRRYLWLLLAFALSCLASAVAGMPAVLTLLGALALSTALWRALREQRNATRHAWLSLAALGAFGICAGALLPTLAGLAPIAPWQTLALLAMAWLCALLLGGNYSEQQRQRRLQAHHARLQASLKEGHERSGSALLTRVAHDIRTPMNGILGMAELLLGSPLSAKQRDYVRTLQAAGTELLGQLDDVLDRVRLESGKIELAEVQFDLQALLEECLDALRLRAADAGVELITYVQPQMPRVLCGDPARLRQILRALLEQAFQREGVSEVLLGLNLEESSSDVTRLRVSVQDDGRPLAAEQRELWLAGSSAEGAADTIASGLLVARRLATLMNGSFHWSNSVAGQGNSLWFSIELPGSLPPQPERGNDAALQDVRLLIVDDNQTCRKVLLQQCAAWGIQAQAAASGAEALAMLRTRAHLGERFDAVILDQQMPGMTGLQLASRIMEDKVLREDLLLVMLSGHPDAPGKVSARNAGIKRVLAKPVAGYTLRTTLAEELARAPGTPPPSVEQDIPDDFRVLVAEDNEVSARVIRSMLNKLDVQPDLVGDGAQALQALQREHYDLVLMDCEMPQMDGFDATERLRLWERQQQRPRTPVVALTAHTDQELREKSRQAGMDGHLSKPVELSQLRNTLHHWVEQRASS